MKSDQLIFANPNLQTIDFEIIERPVRNIFIGLFLLVMIPVMFLIFILFSWAVISEGRPLSPISFCLAIFGFLSVYLHRKGCKYLQDPATVFRTDSRDPILYLRSFSSDSEEDKYRTDKKTFEELICLGLAKTGPVIAVGNPAEKVKFMSYLGATRIYLGDNWKESVEKLMLISSLVVIEAGISESVKWELETAKKLLEAERILISFLSLYTSRSHQIFYYDFMMCFNRIFSTTAPPYDRQLGFIYFDTKGSSKSIKLKGIQNFKYKRLPQNPRADNLTVKQIREGLEPVYKQVGLFRRPENN